MSAHFNVFAVFAVTLLLSGVNYFIEAKKHKNFSNYFCNVSYYSVSKERDGRLTLNEVRREGELESALYLPDPDRQLNVLLHGLSGWNNDSFNWHISNALLAVGEKNILIVDYPQLVPALDYEAAVKSVQAIGWLVAKFLSDVTVPLQLIGFSLGAQVAGVVGYALKTQYNQTLRKIIGLDPAGPGFENLDPSKRLDPSDADFVMVMHTAGGLLGKLDPQGHVDFYPNGGLEPQPQCVLSPRPHPSDPTWGWTVLLETMCSHSSAYLYLADSVHGGYTATRCPSWEDFEAGDCQGQPTLPMGLEVPSNARGSYYLRTRPEMPYGEWPLADKDYDWRSPVDDRRPEQAATSGDVERSPRTGRRQLAPQDLVTGLLITASQTICAGLIFKYGFLHG